MVKNIRIQIKDLIKNLKKVMKGGNDAYGSTSLIIEDEIPCEYEWTSQFYNPKMKMLTKIITEKTIYDKELENAKYIDERIGNKENLLFPMKACSGISVDENLRKILQRYNHKDVKKGVEFDKNATTIYILQIENGGESLEKLNENGQLRTFNDNELISIIDDIVGGIKHLHSKAMPHGDISPENITIRRDIDRPRAYIIDLGEANNKATYDSKVLFDAKNAINCVHLIAQNLSGNNPMKNGLTNIRETLNIEALIGELTKLHQSTKSDEEIEREFRERFGPGMVNYDDQGTPPSSPVPGVGMSSPKSTPKSSPKRRRLEMTP